MKLYSDRLSLALWASRDGFWDWDIVQDRMFLSGPEEFLGGQRETAVAADVWRKHVVHPEDRERVMAALEAHIDQPPCRLDRRARARHRTRRERSRPAHRRHFPRHQPGA